MYNVLLAPGVWVCELSKISFKSMFSVLRLYVQVINVIAT